MYRNNQKEPKRTHTKKLPDWVPEKKVTNPFLNLLLRKNERAIDDIKKIIVKLLGKRQQNSFKRKKTSKSNCKNV